MVEIYSRVPMADHSAFSHKLSECMDLSGYSLDMIKYRQQANTRLDTMYNEKVAEITRVRILTTGGKGEGTAKYFESDIDRLYSHTEMICIDTNDIEKDYMYQGEPMTVFRSRPEGCSPGYTRIEMIRLCEGNFFDLIQKSLVNEGKCIYMQNDFPGFTGESPLYDINGMPINEHTRSGPSRSASNTDISYDFAHGIVLDSKGHLTEWAKRTRIHDWPSSELIKDVLDTNGHVVPVASKANAFLKTEWRICYTKAELLLLRSMTEVQLKIYILMKLTSRSVLKPISKEISSYVNKNLMFWMVEMNQSIYFTMDNLFPLFCEALSLLRSCLEEGKLSNYIIPERNLFEGRLNSSQRKQLVVTINGLLSAGEGMFSELTLGKTMTLLETSPEKLNDISKTRDEAETLLLKRNVAFKRVEVETFCARKGLGAFRPMLEKDEEFKHIGECLADLLLPGKRRLQEGNGDVAEAVKERLIEILS